MMRTIFGATVWVVALVVLVAGLVAAGWWVHFIWSFDWGNSSRGRWLWMMALIWPAFLGFMGVVMAVVYFVVELSELISKSR